MSSQPQPAQAPPAAPAVPAWRARLRRHANWKLAGALLLLGGVLYVGWRTAFPPPLATLVVRGTHNFRSAKLIVSVDGSVAEQTDLSGVVRKKFGILESVQGSFAQPVSVPAGEHTIRVQVTSPDEGYGQSKEIQGNFTENRERTLSVSADKRGALYLAWRDNGGTEFTKADSASGGIGKLFASLMLTISGSILSAVVGFLVQERMRALRDKAKK